MTRQLTSVFRFLMLSTIVHRCSALHGVPTLRRRVHSHPSASPTRPTGTSYLSPRCSTLCCQPLLYRPVQLFISFAHSRRPHTLTASTSRRRYAPTSSCVQRTHLPDHPVAALTPLVLLSVSCRCIRAYLCNDLQVQALVF